MTRAQAMRVKSKLTQIRRLAEEASRAFGDDPMEGDVYTALNNVTAACDWAQDALDRTLPERRAP